MKIEVRSIRVWALNMQLELLLRRFYRLIFCTVLKILICCSLIKRFPNDHKIYSNYLQVSILRRVVSIKTYLKFMTALKTAI